jgi:DNA-directed RNA polymerase specialized sigma24 family protein
LVKDSGLSHFIPINQCRKGEGVKEFAAKGVMQKKDWELTQSAFHRLLNWFDEGTDSGGQKYLEMRYRLTRYFDRKNCISPEELADETLNRVARRLMEEGSITDTTPAKYCYILAKYVFLERLREQERENMGLGELLASGKSIDNPAVLAEQREKERRLDCLERCTQKLDPASRELIFQYYSGEQRIKIENRRSLASRLGISVNALSIRACRIREKLESCLRECMSQ